MSVTVDADTTLETHYHQRTITFDGAEVEAFRGYTNEGKPWRPDRAEAKWRHGEPIMEVLVSGHFLKKDGTPSVNRGNRRYLTPASSYWYPREPGRQLPPYLYYLFADSPHGGGDYAPPQQP